MSIERTLSDLRPNDVVCYEQCDWVVRCSLLFVEGPKRWTEACLVDQQRESWIVVCQDEPGFVGIGQPVD